MCVLIGMGSICIVFGGWGTSIFDDRGDPENGNFSTSLLIVVILVASHLISANKTNSCTH